jgi:hypothetical protein
VSPLIASNRLGDISLRFVAANLSETSTTCCTRLSRPAGASRVRVKGQTKQEFGPSQIPGSRGGAFHLRSSACVRRERTCATMGPGVFICWYAHPHVLVPTILRLPCVEARVVTSTLAPPKGGFCVGWLLVFLHSSTILSEAQNSPSGKGHICS